MECSVGSGAQPWSGPLWLGIRGRGPRLREQSDMFPSAAIVEGGTSMVPGQASGTGNCGPNPFRRWFQGGPRQPGVGLIAQNIGRVRSHLFHPSVCVGDPDPVLRCIVSGFFANAARFHSTGAYR